MSMKEVSGPALTPEALIGYRHSLEMTQRGQFAYAFNIPLGTLRRWEQGSSGLGITSAELTLFNNIVAWKTTIKKRSP